MPHQVQQEDKALNVTINMYLPKSQYKIVKQTDLSDNTVLLKNAAGEEISQNVDVILTSFGTIFDKKGIDFDKGDFSNATQLFIEEFDEDVDRDTEDNPTLSSSDRTVALKLPPTSEDRKKGVMQRCFYKNKCTGKLKEISKVQLLNLARTPDKCVQLATMNWLIKGPAKDQTIKGYVLEGVESRNKRSLEELKKIMPGVEAIVKSPLEYVEDTFIPTGKEIKPQDKDIVIPSPGKRL